MQARRGSARARLKLLFDRITQPCWIALAVLGQLDYALGNHEDAGISAINEAQGAQGILECGRDRNHVFGREERAVLLQYRPDRHDVPRNPQSRSLALHKWLAGSV